MNRRAGTFVTVLTTVVVCLASFEVASAVTAKHLKLPATQAIQACATSEASLRLPKDSGKCPSGTAKVSLARPATAPQALTLDITTGTQTKSLPLSADTSLKADCAAGGMGGNNATLLVVHNGQTQIDGTAFVGENGGDGDVNFQYTAGGGNETPAGASSVYSTSAGGFNAHADSFSFATVNTNLIVTEPNESFDIQAVVDANGPSHYCRISAVVESATS